MSETNTESNTVKLHCVFTAPPERVFKAFIDPDALVKWMAPHGFTAKVHHLDAKVGGTYKMSFSNFSTGSSHSFGGTYHEIIANQLLRYTDQFDDPNLPGTIEVIIQLKAVSVGTEVHITQSGIPDVIPVEACYLGWQESLLLLTLLVTPEIPDQ
ncbi:toxin [Acinetobacter sp. ANC 3903]|uniref:SRPBCC family protein n=1 Tax=Acinetobacter sp. ANC 3903 TaxID=1977883 RepID=UPI000A32CF44|nr:SRPBCC family protein [Acinetobacter sp. ANC 3903]OTG62275.1 toxin [Acinetobacter sp. ANC 3903]